MARFGVVASLLFALLFAAPFAAHARVAPDFPMRPQRALLGHYGNNVPDGSYGVGVGAVTVQQMSLSGSPVAFSVRAQNAQSFVTRCSATPFTMNPMTITYGAVSSSGAAAMDILGALDNIVYDCTIYGTRGGAAGPVTNFRFSPKIMTTAVAYQTIGKTTAFVQLITASTSVGQKFYARCSSLTKGASISARVVQRAPDAADVYLYGLTPAADYTCDFLAQLGTATPGPVNTVKFTTRPAGVPEQPALLSVAPGVSDVEIVAVGSKVVPGEPAVTYSAACWTVAAPDAITAAKVIVGASTITVDATNLPRNSALACSIIATNDAGFSQSLYVPFETGYSLPAPVTVRGIVPAKTTAAVETTASANAESYDIDCAATDFAIDAPASSFTASGTDTSVRFDVKNLLPSTTYACTMTSHAKYGARGGRTVAYVQTTSA